MIFKHEELYALREKILPSHLLNYESTRSDFIEVEDSASFFKSVLSAKGYISLDTETYYNPNVGAKDGVITHWIKGEPQNVPFGISVTMICEDGVKRSFWVRSELDKANILFKTDSDTAPLIIGHNLKYDLSMLRNIGIDILYRILKGVKTTTIYADTLTMVHAFDEEHRCRRPDGGMVFSKKLKDLGFHYLDQSEQDSHYFEDLVDQVRIAIARYFGISKNSVDYYAVQCIAPKIMKDYACYDTDMTFDLYPILLEKLMAEETVPAYEIDMNAMIVTHDMQYTGIKVDIDKMREDEGKCNYLIKMYMRAMFDMTKYEFNVNSDKELISAFLKVFNHKWENFTDKGMPDTSAATLKLLAKSKPETEKFVSYIIWYRKVQKLLSTYITGVYKFIQDDGRAHANFNINPNEFDKGGTVTGRLSSDNPNLQNQTKKPLKIPDPYDENNVYVFIPRNYYIADDGYTFIFNDYDAQEYSVLGHYSRDKAYIDGLNAGLDIHKFTYAELESVPYDEVTTDQRSQGKTYGFSIVYQIGNAHFAVSLGRKIDVNRLEAATRFLYSKIPAYELPPYRVGSVLLEHTLDLADTHFNYEIDNAKNALEDAVSSLTPDNKQIKALQKNLSDLKSNYAAVKDGLAYFYDDYVQDSLQYAIEKKRAYMDKFQGIKEFIDKVKRIGAKRLWVRTYFGRKRHIRSTAQAYLLPNALIQGTCADIMKKKLFELWMMLKLEGYKTFLVLTIHDEVATSVHESERFLIPRIIEILEDLPFVVKITVGAEEATKWGEKQEVDMDEFENEDDDF